MKVVGPACQSSETPQDDHHLENPKSKENFRNFKDGALIDRVHHTYLLMHTHQTVEFVQKKNEQFGGCNLRQMTIMEALELLDQVVDESDPDVDFPNSFHAYQTAEGIREKHPEKDWFHLVGLLHDLGKILALAGEPQWAVVGDTFPVGCKLQNSIVFKDSTFHDNPDTKNPAYMTKYGIYQPHCGLENVLMSWGHDEYMYQVMRKNKFTLPEEAFYMVRFHSFYPWHTGGDYMHLCSTKDLQMLPWVQEFKRLFSEDVLLLNQEASSAPTGWWGMEAHEGLQPTQPRRTLLTQGHAKAGACPPRGYSTQTEGGYVQHHAVSPVQIWTQGKEDKPFANTGHNPGEQTHQDESQPSVCV